MKPPSQAVSSWGRLTNEPHIRSSLWDRAHLKLACGRPDGYSTAVRERSKLWRRLSTRAGRFGAHVGWNRLHRVRPGRRGHRVRGRRAAQGDHRSRVAASAARSCLLHPALSSSRSGGRLQTTCMAKIIIAPGPSVSTSICSCCSEPTAERQDRVWPQSGARLVRGDRWRARFDRSHRQRKAATAKSAWPLAGDRDGEIQRPTGVLRALDLFREQLGAYAAAWIDCVGREGRHGEGCSFAAVSSFATILRRRFDRIKLSLARDAAAVAGQQRVLASVQPGLLPRQWTKIRPVIHVLRTLLLPAR